MIWPSLWQYGALPAGGSWQLWKRSVPGGNSEVLRQLHVFNETWINRVDSKNWSSLGISVGWRTGTSHFQCGFLNLEGELISAHLPTLEGEQIFACPITLNFCNSTIENIGTLSWRLNWGHMNIGTPISELEFSGPFMECTLDDGGVLWAGGSIVKNSTESWA